MLMPAPDLNAVVPYFQPIIKSTDLGVFAYEVLAREERGGKVRSLGPYFENPAVSDQDKLALDMHVRKRAFEAYAASGCEAKLFINLKPSWICAFEDSALSTLVMLEQHKIDPQQIVVEVVEEELSDNVRVFGKALSEFRKAGCMLAIDDFGRGASSMERIAHTTPDIIKVDRSIVQRTDINRSFYELCHAMDTFGAISGFDLLFEGVETAFQLERCVKTGWCYLQGFIFSQARKDFEIAYANRDLLADILYIEDNRKAWNMKCRNEVAANMECEVERLRPLIPVEEEALREPAALRDLAKALPYYCVRCVVCDHKGRRLSRIYQHEGQDTGTAMRRDSAMEMMLHGLFIRGMDALYAERLGYLSQVYKNATTKENIMTYVHKLRQDRLLCVDIMPTVLF